MKTKNGMRAEVGHRGKLGVIQFKRKTLSASAKKKSVDKPF